MEIRRPIGVIVCLIMWSISWAWTREVRADVISMTYNVDPARSVVTLSGTYAGHAFQAQAGFPNSLRGAYSGTISANRDFVQGTLQLTGGTVSAIDNGAFAPLGLPANYGIDTSNAFNLYSAIRNFAIMPTSSIIPTPASFDASLVAVTIQSGLFDHFEFGTAYPGGASNQVEVTSDLTGPLTLAALSGSVSDFAQSETITLPIESTLTLEAGGYPLVLNFSGAIVATTGVPEPGSLVLLASAIIFVMNLRPIRRNW